MTKRQLLVSALLLGLLLAACVPKAAPVDTPAAPSVALTGPAPAGAPVSASPAQPAWQAQWQKTLEAARKEGRVVFATTLGSAGNTIMQGFKKAYGIPVESISGRSTDVAEKILRERRAGLYNYDVFVGGSSTVLNFMKPGGALDPLEPALILPDVTDPELIKKTWWPEKLWWVDTDRIIMAPMLTLILPLAINTNLVKEGEIKSYRDLLNPKWQGKTLVNDPTVVGAGVSWIIFAEAMFGWDYVVELAKTKPIVLRDRRQQLDWLAHGKVAVLTAPKPDTLVEFIQAGAPVKGLIPAEGTWMLGGSSSLSILNRPPHPNAAKIFINWYLSKEGQTFIGPPAGYQSNRVDVPTDHLPPDQLRQPGVKYFVAEDEKVQMGQPALMKKTEPLFGMQ